jgi:hypothetical protein
MTAPAINRHKSANYIRDPHDRYVEDAACVDALLDWLKLAEGTEVYDPCAGTGNIVDRCNKHGLKARGSDLIDRGREDIEPGIDFLSVINLGMHRRADWIISNPPFYHGDGHVQFHLSAWQVARYGVAMICPAPLLYSRKRQDFWREYRPAAILFLSRRPSMPPGEVLAAGGKRGGGKEDYFWAIWTKDDGVETIVAWI